MQPLFNSKFIISRSGQGVGASSGDLIVGDVSEDLQAIDEDLGAGMAGSEGTIVVTAEALLFMVIFDVMRLLLTF